MKNLSFISILILMLFSCKHDLPIIEDKRILELKYTPSYFELAYGDASQTQAPIFISETKTQFELRTTPETQKITIDSLGKIRIDSGLASGFYQIDVKASNEAGSNTFFSAIEIKILAEKTSYEVDVRPILVKNCVRCHDLFSEYFGAQAYANEISERIKLTESDKRYMPQFSTPVPQKDIAIIEKWISDGLLEK